ncbi:hypothetical protein KRP22_009695 [Phytophthora ramorum]|nr:hypothetical protein KRP22_14640 [Phytophthora ramorum]
MRLSSILLVAAAVFLVRCDAVSTATESEQNTFSAVTAPRKNARLLRTTEMEKDDDLDSDDEERVNFSSITKLLNPVDDVATAAAKKLQPQQVAKLSKLDDVKPSYLNNPLLKPEGEALKLAQKFETQMMAQLGKTDEALFKKINTTPGAAERISRWRLAEWDPTDLAKFYKKSYPLRFKPKTPEKEAWNLYAAMVLRRDFSVK